MRGIVHPCLGRVNRRRYVSFFLGALLAAALLTSGASASTLSATQKQYLSTVEQGFKQATAHWANKRYHWYNSVENDRQRYPLASIWDMVPLFETASYTAEASPTSANVSRVKTFANWAERYWDKAVRPYPGASGKTPAYAPYPNSWTNLKTYFDDNSWWGLAFLDAAQAMKKTGYASSASRYIADAKRAFGFVAGGFNHSTGAQGYSWDSTDGGGIWWNNRHIIPGGHGRSGEALAASTDLAARLYQATGQLQYYWFAVRNITWANQHLQNWDGAYGLPLTNSMRMPHDGEGALIDSFTALCEAKAPVPLTVYAGIPLNNGDPTGNYTERLPSNPASWCSWAEELAHHTAYGIQLQGWQHAQDSVLPLNDGPQWDDIYVRDLLNLYALDHNSGWYTIANNTAQRIVSKAQSSPGMFMKAWNGDKSVPGSTPGMIRTDGSSLSVLAAVAAA